MKNVSAEIRQGISQTTGKPYKQLVFKIQTSQGVYESRPVYPTALEMQLVEQAISPVSDMWGDEN